MAMENGQFDDIFPIEDGGLFVATLVYWSVKCGVPIVGPFSFCETFLQKKEMAARAPYGCVAEGVSMDTQGVGA